MGMFQDYLRGVAMAKNPQLLKRRLANMDAEEMRNTVGEMFGQAATPEQTAPYQMGADERMEGEEPIQGLMDVTQEAMPGSGLIGSAGSPEEARYLQARKELGMSGQGIGLDQSLEGLNQMQQSVMGNAGKAGRAGSTPTFEMGAPGGMKQRAYFGPNNKIMPVGEPYRPFAPQQASAFQEKVDALGSSDPDKVAVAREALRDPYKKTELGYVDTTGKGRYIDREVAEGVVVKGMAEADTSFYNEYGNATQTLENTAYDLDRTMNDLNRLADMTDYSSTGFAGYLSIIPTTDARSWESMRDTVINNLGLDKMMQLKALSSSGATGFGALSARELAVLTDHLGKLDGLNDPKEIKYHIKAIYKSLNRNKNNIMQAMKRNEKRYKGIDKRYERYLNRNRTKEGVMKSQQGPATQGPKAGWKWDD